jgi:hypothetical protein
MRTDGFALGEVTGGRITWKVDRDRRVLTIRVSGPVTDEDLSSGLPRMWERHPEVVTFSTLVDARDVNNEGEYSWRGLRDVARQWRGFAGGRDGGSQVAVVVGDGWLAKVARIVAFDYPGTTFRIFMDFDDAAAWIGAA